jgi:peroxiredoxin
MAQLRQDYQAFADRRAEILVVCPEKAEAVRQYWHDEQLPFVGLADPDHTVAKLFGQQVRLIKLGRMPALVMIDQQGRVYYQHHGNSMKDIPANADVLSLVDKLNQGINLDEEGLSLASSEAVDE